jgi:hypothetical protein
MLLRKLYHVKRKLRRASDNGQFTGRPRQPAAGQRQAQGMREGHGMAASSQEGPGLARGVVGSVIRAFRTEFREEFRLGGICRPPTR